jgi:hypothetical protein
LQSAPALYFVTQATHVVFRVRSHDACEIVGKLKLPPRSSERSFKRAEQLSLAPKFCGTVGTLRDVFFETDQRIGV